MNDARTILDSGIAYALLDRTDMWHGRAIQWTAAAQSVLILPVTTIPEVAHLVRRRLGAEYELHYARSLAEHWDLVELLLAEDVRRITELMSKYESIGFVDASVVAIAERLGVTTIATTDRRDFATIRPRHVERFTLVP